MTPTPRRTSRIPLWAPFVVLTAALLAQMAVVQGGWLLEDARLIRDSADVQRGPAGIPRLFSAPSLEGELIRGDYRPLMMASFALEAPLWSGDEQESKPFGFHLTNLLLHGLAAVLLLFALGRAVPGRPWLALGTALLFAIHPMNTGTVGSLLGRADLLGMVFGTAAVLVWLRPGGMGPIELTWFGLFAFLACMSKEALLALPIVLVVADRARGAAPRQARAGALVLGVVIVLYLLLWPGRAPGPADLPSQSLASGAGLALAGVGRTLLRLLLPVGFRGDHSDEASALDGFLLEGALLWSAILIATLTVLATVWLIRNRHSLVAGCFIGAVAMALAIALTQPSSAVLELRFAYLAGLLLFVPLGRVFETLVTARAGLLPTRLGWAGAAGLLLVLGGVAHAEARAWHDDASFHTRLLDERPGHIRALVRQARTARLRARSLRAQAALMPTQDARGRPSPQLARVRRNLDQSLAESEGWIRRALSQASGRQNAAVWAELGYIFLARGQAAAGVEAIQRAKLLDPVLQRSEGVSAEDFDRRQIEAAAALYFAEGECRTGLNDVAGASGSYRSAMQLSPRNPRYLRKAAMGLMHGGRWGEGLPLLEKAISLATSSRQREELEALLMLQQTRAVETAVRRFQQAEQENAANHFKQAMNLYEAAFQANPRYIDAYVRAARIRGSYMGDYKRAAKYLLEAERLLKDSQGSAAAKLTAIKKERAFLAKRKREDDEEVAREAEAAAGDDNGMSRRDPDPDK